MRDGGRGKIKSIAGIGLVLALLTSFSSISCAQSSAAEVAPVEDRGRRLALILRQLDRTDRLLYVTAHPDDEDGGLLAYYALGQGIETGLLTLTRGEGGQNEIGTELFHALGVLRSRESQGARAHDGASQYFSRAFEFGYSFSVEETYEKWGKQGILQDMVYVIRKFRPDVIVTLPPGGEGGGQHHQASARLAREAFDLAADPKRWRQLGVPHRTRRLFRQIWGSETPEAVCEISLAGYDPILGASYAEVGARSRGMHKCQGMVRLHEPFFPRTSRLELLVDSGQEVVPRADLFDGLDETLVEESGSVTPWGAELRRRAAAIRSRFRIEDPEAILDELLALHEYVRVRKESRSARRRDLLETLERRLGEAVALSAGVRWAVRCDRECFTEGESIRGRLVVENTGTRGVRVIPRVGRNTWTQLTELPEIPLPGRTTEAIRFSIPVRRLRQVLGRSWGTLAHPVSEQPTPEGPAKPLGIYPGWESFGMEGILRIGDQEVALPRVPFEFAEVRKDFPRLQANDVQIVPDPALRPGRPVVAAPTTPGERPEATVEFRVRSLHAGDLRVRLEVPNGWHVEPAERVLQGGPTEQTVRFQVRGPAEGSLEPVVVRGWARFGEQGAESDRGYRIVDYPHIRRGLLEEVAEVRVVPFPCVTVARRVATVAGTGDEMARALDALGYRSTALTAEDLLEGDLSVYDVIITGVRAYKVREDLKRAQGRLFAWVEAGGILLVQYNKLEFNDDDPRRASPHAPWRGARVGRRRVTLEEAPVRVLLEDHPVFRTPQAIGDEDWAGWVQERGLYFLDTKDERYRELLEIADPFPYNAGPQRGALVEARMGKGRWIYIGLGLFRQLPAGVPGAYRLLANLLALEPEAP